MRLLPPGAAAPGLWSRAQEPVPPGRVLQEWPGQQEGSTRHSGLGRACPAPQGASTPAGQGETKWKTAELAGVAARQAEQAEGQGRPGRGGWRGEASPGLSTMMGEGPAQACPVWRWPPTQLQASQPPRLGVAWTAARVQQSRASSLGRGPRLGCGAGLGLAHGFRGAAVWILGLLGRGCWPRLLRCGRFLGLLRGQGGPDWLLAGRLWGERGVRVLRRLWTARGGRCPLGLR